MLVTDPPYGIELDSEWRDRARLNGCGAAEPSYMKRRTDGHKVTSISGDTRADWSEAFALVPSIEVGYVWHASKFTREVLDGLLRIGFEHHQQIIWDKERAVLTRTHYWFQHEPCWYVRTGYEGERHVSVAKHLPMRNGQEWVEFEEVAGPEPSPPPPNSRLPNRLNVIFVGPPGEDREPPE